MENVTKARRVDHVAISVGDMERSLQFYCGLLGMVQHGGENCEGPVFAKLHGTERMRLKIVFLVCPDKPETVLELVQYLDPRGKQSKSKLCDVGSGHICFEVADIHKTYSELKATGTKSVSEPMDITLEDGRKVCVVFLSDPDGYMLELVTFFKSK